MSEQSLAERLLRLADGHYSFDDDDTTPRDDPTPSQYDAMVVEHQKAARKAADELDRLEAVVAAWKEHHFALTDLQWAQLGDMKQTDPSIDRECKARAALVQLGELPGVMMPDREAT